MQCTAEQLLCLLMQLFREIVIKFHVAFPLDLNSRLPLPNMSLPNGSMLITLLSIIVKILLLIAGDIVVVWKAYSFCTDIVTSVDIYVFISLLVCLLAHSFIHSLIYLFVVLEAVACRGDVIGCTVKFENDPDADGKVEIVFTLNGKQITQDKIEMEYSLMYSSSRKMYPYICMGHTGMSVLAKVCFNYPLSFSHNCKGVIIMTAVSTLNMPYSHSCCYSIYSIFL